MNRIFGSQKPKVAKPTLSDAIANVRGFVRGVS
jgi:hypothetical protein